MICISRRRLSERKSLSCCKKGISDEACVLTGQVCWNCQSQRQKKQWANKTWQWCSDGTHLLWPLLALFSLPIIFLWICSQSGPGPGFSLFHLINVSTLLCFFLNMWSFLYLNSSRFYLDMFGQWAPVLLKCLCEVSLSAVLMKTWFTMSSRLPGHSSRTAKVPPPTCPTEPQLGCPHEGAVRQWETWWIRTRLMSE